MAPPRIVHIIRPETQGSIGGADLHVIDLCAAQNDSGAVRAAVVALGASQDFLQRARQAQVAVHDPMRPRRGRWRRLAGLPRSIEVDIIHAHGYEADYAAAVLPIIAPAWRGLPCVITCHGLITPDLRHKIMGAVDLRCMRRARALITVAESSAEALRRAVPRLSVHVISNGAAPPSAPPTAEDVTRARAEMGAQDGDVLIGYVGRLSAEKRPDLFLKAAETVAATNSRARFVYVGGGTLAAETQKAVAASPASKAITIAGLRNDMDAVYGALDMLVLPSDAEGTPRVVLEAQMRGVPVIASAVGGMFTQVEHEVTGLLVPPDQYLQTAAAIQRLAMDNHLRDRMTRDARHTALRATSKRMAQAVLAIYTATAVGR